MARLLRAVDGVRHQFLARAGFTQDQHIRRGVGHGLDPRQHRAQCGAAADDPAEVHRHANLLAKVVALPFEFLLEARDLAVGVLQPRFGPVALGDVLAGHQRADRRTWRASRSVWDDSSTSRTSPLRVTICRGTFRISPALMISRRRPTSGGGRRRS